MPATTLKGIYLNKYLPVAILYFFFNSFLLPLGLLYTTILTPLLLLWLAKYRSIQYIVFYFLLTIPFAIIHFYNGVDTFHYLKSSILLFCTFIFGLSCYQFLRQTVSLRQIFKYLLLANFVLVGIACITWFIPPLRSWFWWTSTVSWSLQATRLKLLTYEPSYYSTLLVPLAMYYYLKMLLLRLPNAKIYSILVTVPLLLAFSLGILLGIPICIALLFLLNMKLLVTNKKTFQSIVVALALLAVVLLILFVFFPDNPLFFRIFNIFRGRDSSLSGRTSDAFYLAWQLIKENSILFGVGPGQVKILGLELWNQFYHYHFTPDMVTIPCAAAETMALFGVVGLVLRIGLEIFFFYYTKVYTNYYRYALFLFIFIYQFTGSYISNIAEFVIWILAFNNTFAEFDRKNLMMGMHRTGLDNGHK